MRRGAAAPGRGLPAATARGSAGSTLAGANDLQQGGQVKALDELPDGASMVFWGHQVLQRHSGYDNLPVGTPQPRWCLGREQFVGRGWTQGLGVRNGRRSVG